MTKEQMTYGQQAVRLSNQSGNNPLIQDLKQTIAEIIDQVYETKQQSSDPEVRKFCSKAITDFETGVAWAEKAIILDVLQGQTNESELRQHRGQRHTQSVS
ncbi:MAG TPA: hypothetical protein VN958_12305 [Chitinophagaceae bacterium]|nr:hypothetical protein [Chitinophagaceae bacterium]